MNPPFSVGNEKSFIKIVKIVLKKIQFPTQIVYTKKPRIYAVSGVLKYLMKFFLKNMN